MKAVCTLVLLICLYSSSTAQSVLVKGVVIIGKQPVSSANVVVSSGDSTYGYTVTKSDGKFSIRVPVTKQQLIVTVSHISIEKIAVPLSEAILSSGQELVIQPTSRTTPLPEVRIESVRKGYSERGDTTSFAASQYADGTEVVVEDLLKKIPGIRVSNDGKISFKGKEISKVMFEGTDLYKSNYRVVTKNLTNKIIDSVQAVENFNPNELLKGITSGNETILNIVIKDDQKGKFSGNANVNIGNAYENSANAFLFKKKYQLVSLYTGNNMGNTETGLYDESSSKEIINRNNAFIIPITDLPAPQLPFGIKNTIPNNTHLFSASFGTKKKDHYSYTGNINYSRNELSQSSFTTEKFLPIPDSIFLQSGRSTNQSLSKFSGVFEFEHTLQNTLTLSNYLDIQIQQSSLSGLLTLPTLSLQEHSNAPSANIFHLLEATKKLDTNEAILFSVRSQYVKGKQQYDNSAGVNYDILNSGATPSAINTVFYNVTTYTNSTGIQYFHKVRNNRFTVDLTNDFSRSFLNIGTRFIGNANSKTANEQENVSIISRFSLKEEIALKAILFSIQAGVSYQQNNSVKKNIQWFPTAKMGVKLSVSKKSFLLVFGGIGQSFTDINYTAAVPLLKDYRTIQNSLANPRYFTTANAGILYGFSNFIKGLDISSSLLWQNGSVSVVRFYKFTGINSIANLSYGPATNFVTANVGISKYIPVLNLYVKVDLAQTYNNSFNGIDSSSIQNYKVQDRSVATELRSAFNMPINFTLKSKFGVQSVRISTINAASSVNSFELKGRIRYTISKDWQCYLDANHYRISNASATKKTNFVSLFHLEAKYAAPGKRWQVRGRIQNIGNVQAITNYSFSEIILAEEETSILGRRSTIGFSYSF